MMEFLFNPARLSFQIPCVLGGILLCGDRGEPRRAGNGDCIILDGATGLIGVADGAERSPQASRQFLEGMADHMSRTCADNGRPCPEALFEAAQAVLDTFGYEDRTTFLCILPDSQGSVSYLSGGDSLLMHLDLDHSRVLFRNRSNMGFAGRSRELLDFGHLQAYKGDLLLLATDGLWDIQREDGEDFLEVIFSALRTGPVHLLSARLVTGRHPAFCPAEGRPYDDLGLVLLDPFQIEPFGYRVLLGGTDSDSELSYQSRCRNRDFPDQYIRLPENGPPLWVFPDFLSDSSSMK